MAHWTAKQIPNLEGKRAIVTGANSGLGFHTARQLARAGAEVVLACRSVQRGEAAAERIRAGHSSVQLEVRQLDLSVLASVREFAARVLNEKQPVDVLVNNAGIMGEADRQTSADGFELTMASNYFGHFALTGLLLPALLSAATPRVVSISSNAHQRAKLHLDDLQQKLSYHYYKSYAQTKLAVLVFAKELQRRSDAHNAKLVSVAAHPGLSPTAIVRNLPKVARVFTSAALNFLGQSDAQGALPQLFAATAAEVTPGGYYGPDGLLEFKGYPSPAKISAQAENRDTAKQIWDASEQLTGVAYDWTAGA